MLVSMGLFLRSNLLKPVRADSWMKAMLKSFASKCAIDCWAPLKPPEVQTRGNWREPEESYSPAWKLTEGLR